jgi:hypothetical protein
MRLSSRGHSRKPVGNIAYGATDLAELETLAKHPQVEQIDKQRKAQLQLDESGLRML